MKKKTLALTLASIMISSLTIQSCKKEGCTDEMATNYEADAKDDDGSCEFVYGCMDAGSLTFNADAVKDDGSCRSFDDWSSWTLTATNQGPSPSLGNAHAGNDSTVTRKVYFLDSQSASDGKYPVGTMIIKHTSNGDGTLEEYTGMLKRESGFNAGSGDWEWFVLNADGSVAKDNDGMELRGGNLLSGFCLGCHSHAATDYVFTK
ncbi:MAG: hypothetical protein R2813_11410 [Flavobacteriales bacterium]